MKLEQALGLLFQAAQQGRFTAAEHDQIKQAANILFAVISPKKEDPKPAPVKK